MPVADVLSCTDEDLWPILDSDEPEDKERWFRAKGIGMIELSQLGEMLGVDSYDNLADGFVLVGEPRDDGPWPQTIPDSVIKRLSALSDDEIAVVVPQWLELEEFQGAALANELTDYLKRLRAYLSKRSGRFFLINAL